MWYVVHLFSYYLLTEKITPTVSTTKRSNRRLSHQKKQQKIVPTNHRKKQQTIVPTNHRKKQQKIVPTNHQKKRQKIVPT